eukprot:TRINITY_DN10045_c0_g1_i1.p1 TRINITY_DN10045_c0_g1~~TRINITY_DN10045_c0_g1_i1.p1  ORF type:complete len:216 (-),score=30.19 TRINITY_DN10045_c0_g1_i1:34-681(-)
MAAMNIFRLGGDMVHLLSILLLLLKIRATRNCVGISLKSQELLALVFVTRYLDLFLYYVSLYNTMMKIFFITSSVYIIYLMRVRYRATYDREHDTFRVVFLLVPCFVLALVINEGYTIVEILWAFSIYLESVAILPQLFMLQRTGDVENLTSHYIFLLGSYRALYLFNWIYRYYTTGWYDWIVLLSGVLQTGLYCDYIYYYLQSKWYKVKLTLPK